MIPILEKQANVPGIAAGAECTLGLPRKGIHHGLYLMCRKAAKAPMSRTEIIADIGRIILRVNGDTKIEATAQTLLDLYKYWFDKNGAHTVAGVIPIPLWRPNLIPALDRSLVAWGMKDVISYQLEVVVTAVVTLVSIEPWCEIEDGNRNLGRHLCIGYHGQSHAATGVQELTTLPYGDPDVGVLVAHIGESTADIDNVSVQAGYPSRTQVIIDQLPMEMNNHILTKAGRTGQTDYYHADFSQINDKAGYLPSGPMRSLRYKIDWEVAGGAPGNYVIHTEEVRGLSKPIV